MLLREPGSLRQLLIPWPCEQYRRLPPAYRFQLLMDHLHKCFALHCVPPTNLPPAVGMGEVEMNNVNITCTSLEASPDWQTAPRRRIANVSQLLSALDGQAAAGGPGSAVLEITSSIVLDDASVQGARLPYTVSRGRTLALVGGE